MPLSAAVLLKAILLLFGNICFVFYDNNVSLLWLFFVEVRVNPRHACVCAPVTRKNCCALIVQLIVQLCTAQFQQQQEVISLCNKNQVISVSGQTGSLTLNTLPGTQAEFKVNNAGGESCCGRATLWQLCSVMRGTVAALFMFQPSFPLTLHWVSTHNTQLMTYSPSVVLLLFLLMNATVPGLVSSEPSTELLLITRSSSFFPVISAATASSSSSSSWSEYWLKASTNSLKISSLINPPSETKLNTSH